MMRYVLTGVVGVLVGVALAAGLFVVANPIPSSLVCSVQDDVVTDCTTEDGDEVDIPHTVHIR
jgi:hypothetical protein